MIRLNQVYYAEDKIETASQYIHKEGVVLPGTSSHMIVSDTQKAPCTKGRGKDVN